MSAPNDSSIWDVYAQHLRKLGLGCPLWQPELTSSGDVLPGDVGYLDKGGFHRIFNTIDPPSKDDDGCLPDGFEFLELSGRRDRAIRTRNAVMDAGFHYGRTILDRRPLAEGSTTARSHTPLAKAGATYTFTCSGDQGAIIYFQHRVNQIMLHENPRSYILRNHSSWSDFARYTRNLPIGEGDLIFIRASIKGPAQWALGAIGDNGRSGAFSINTRSVRRTKPARFRRSAESLMNLQESHSLHRGAGGTPRGQCFFVNYWKVKRRRSLVPHRIRAAAEPRDPSGKSVDHDDEDKDQVKFLSTRSAGPSQQARDELEVVPGPYENKPCDPVDYVLTYILNSCYADIAIASDSVLVTLCKLYDEEFPDDVAAFLDRIKPKMVVVHEDRAGMLECEDLLFDEIAPPRPMEVGTASQHQKNSTDRVESPDKGVSSLVISGKEKTRDVVRSLNTARAQPYEDSSSEDSSSARCNVYDGGRIGLSVPHHTIPTD